MIIGNQIFGHCTKQVGTYPVIDGRTIHSDNTDEKHNYFTSWFSRFHHCLGSIYVNGRIAEQNVNDPDPKPTNPCEPHKCDNTWESINEKLFKTGLIMYPNPATDQVYILFPTNFITTSGKLHIISSDGKVFKEITIRNTSSVSIEISEIVSGLYYCRVITEDGKILSAKFIKQ